MTVAEENGVGSTIKTEEEEDSDPYAVLTVISCRVCRKEKDTHDVLTDQDRTILACEARSTTCYQRRVRTRCSTLPSHRI